MLTLVFSNIGILFAYMLGLGATYLLATEYITEKKSKGEVLLFRRGEIPKNTTAKSTDEESALASFKKQSDAEVKEGAKVARQTAIFHWEDVCYDIKIKSEERRILDHVDGWVKPGTLTALMVRIKYPDNAQLFTNSVFREFQEQERRHCSMFLLAE